MNKIKIPLIAALAVLAVLAAHQAWAQGGAPQATPTPTHPPGWQEMHVPPSDPWNIPKPPPRSTPTPSPAPTAPK